MTRISGGDQRRFGWPPGWRVYRIGWHDPVPFGYYRLRETTGYQYVKRCEAAPAWARTMAGISPAEVTQ